MAEHVRSVFVEHPKPPLAEIGHLVSMTRDVHRQLFDMQADLQASRTELLAMDNATAGEVQLRLAQAEEELAPAKSV